MIIAQISDTHIALETEDSAQRIHDFEAVIKDINSLSTPPDLIVHTGDIVHNGLTSEYEKCNEIIEQSNIPVYVLVGNKDNRENLRNTFKSHSYLSTADEFINYHLDRFPIRMLMLDTLCLSTNKGDFCETRFDQLRSLLNEGADRPTIVFMHHPPMNVLVGPEQLHFKTEIIMHDLQAELIAAKQVIAIFTGHVHRETTGIVGHIPTSIMSAVATSVRWGTYPDRMKNRPTYQIHEFDEKSGFSTQTRIV